MRQSTSKNRAVTLDGEDIDNAIRKELARKGIYPPKDAVFWILNGLRGEQLSPNTRLTTSWVEEERS